MEEWQQRVVFERVELADKLAKLRGMLAGPLYEKLEDIDQLLLCRQARAMETYRDILDERVARFKEPT
jgi:hypothetical protein